MSPACSSEEECIPTAQEEERSGHECSRGCSHRCRAQAHLQEAAEQAEQRPSGPRVRPQTMVEGR